MTQYKKQKKTPVHNINKLEGKKKQKKTKQTNTAPETFIKAKNVCVVHINCLFGSSCPSYLEDHSSGD